MERGRSGARLTLAQGAARASLTSGGVLRPGPIERRRIHQAIARGKKDANAD